MRVPDVNTIDFESKAIKRRPQYPPKPTSVSIQLIGEKKPTFYCWGHPEGNNCDESTPRRIITDLVKKTKEPMLFQNANFDVDIMQTHWEVGEIDWTRIHDTLYLMFLIDPHARELKLKPMSEKWLGMPPDEQDAVKDWILSHKSQIEAVHGRFTPKEFGAHISEVPGQIVQPYANGDVTRTLKMFRKMFKMVDEQGMMPSYNRERELAPIMLRNEREGVALDIKRLEQDIKIYTAALAKAEDYIRKVLKAPNLNIDSDKDVGDLLDAKGIVTDWVLTPTGQRSVAKKNLTPSMFNNQKLAQALGYRNRLVTCLGTFMQTWLELGYQNNGRIHTSWNQVRNSESGGGGARTGRMSCSPNLMNIPTEFDEKGDGYAHPAHLNVPPLPHVRNYVVPSQKGWLFGGRDYNQQELRILAHFEDGDLMNAYQENPELDTHSFVKGVIEQLLHKEVPRKTIKEINFGTIYGQGVGSLAEKLSQTVDTIKEIKGAQLRALPGLEALNKSIKTGSKNGLPIVTWGGRLYFCEEPRRIGGRYVSFEYKLLNYLVQGSAADCTKQGIINYDKIKKEGRFLCSVHDENNIEAPAKAMKAELKILRVAMADVQFDVQMLSEPYMGKSWGEVEKYKEAA